MNSFDLHSPPPYFAPEVRTNWLEDVAVQPSAGEVWLLSWDREVVGLALVTSVMDDYIRAMPITVGAESASGREAILPKEHLGADTTIWYRAETGLGKFLLHRRLADSITADDVYQLRRAAYANEPSPFSAGKSDSDLGGTTLIEVLNEFNALCHLEWPSAAPGEGVLNRGLLDGLGISPIDIANATSLPIPEVLSVWRQDWAVSASVAQAISEAFKVEEEDLLVTALDEHTRELSDPRVKSKVVILSQVSSLSERASRNLARQELSVSGRTDTVSARNATLVNDTLDRLIAEYRDATDAQ